MKSFNLGLNVAGQIQFVLNITEKNLRAAKKEWSRLLGYSGPCWDARTQTFNGWPVVITSEPALQRKMQTNHFSY